MFCDLILFKLFNFMSLTTMYNKEGTEYISLIENKVIE